MDVACRCAGACWGVEVPAGDERGDAGACMCVQVWVWV